MVTLLLSGREADESRELPSTAVPLHKQRTFEGKVFPFASIVWPTIWSHGYSKPRQAGWLESNMQSVFKDPPK